MAGCLFVFLSLIALSKRQPWKYILFCPTLSVSQCHSKIGTFWQFGPIGTGTVTSLYPWNFEDAHDDIHMYADELLVCIYLHQPNLCTSKILFEWMYDGNFWSSQIASLKLYARRLCNFIGCICRTFLQCVFSNVWPICLLQRMHSHIECIRLTFLQCSLSNVSSKCVHEQRHLSHWLHLYDFSPLCVIKCLLK